MPSRTYSPGGATGQAKRTYYEIVGVERDATAAEIRTSYRKRALTCHPDKVKGGDAEKTAAEAEFRELQEAYDVLADENERAEYDKMLLNGGHPAGGNAESNDYGFQNTTKPTSGSKPKSPFESFNQTGGPRFTEARPRDEYAKPNRRSTYTENNVPPQPEFGSTRQHTRKGAAGGQQYHPSSNANYHPTSSAYDDNDPYYAQDLNTGQYYSKSEYMEWARRQAEERARQARAQAEWQAEQERRRRQQEEDRQARIRAERAAEKERLRRQAEAQAEAEAAREEDRIREAIRMAEAARRERQRMEEEFIRAQRPSRRSSVHAEIRPSWADPLPPQSNRRPPQRTRSPPPAAYMNQSSGRARRASFSGQSTRPDRDEYFEPVSRGRREPIPITVSEAEARFKVTGLSVGAEITAKHSDGSTILYIVIADGPSRRRQRSVKPVYVDPPPPPPQRTSTRRGNLFEEDIAGPSRSNTTKGRTVKTVRMPDGFLGQSMRFFLS